MRTYIFALLLAAVAIGDSPVAYAQSSSLSVEDSLQVNALWSRANSVPLYSTARQRCLDTALSIDPHNAYFWQQKAMPLFKQKKYEIGLPYLDSAVKYDPKEYLDYRAFMKCIFSKSYRNAIADFEAARVLNGNSGVMDHPYDFYQGLCYIQLNMFDSGIYYIDRCIQYKTKANGAGWVHPLHWYYEGIAWYEKEDFTQAIRCFDSCQSLYKGFADAQYYKALAINRLTGDKERVLALMKEGRDNMRKGYTFNEDNMVYEKYPYQVEQRFFDGYIERMEEAMKSK